MDIARARQEIENTVRAYLAADDAGQPLVDPVRQRPILLMGPPGVGKTQIVEQAAQACGVALVAYTITHHTRQSAMGLPFIRQKVYGGREYSVTEYTMSEIIASIYETMERTGLHNGILFIDEINCVSETLAPTMLQFLQYKTFGNQAVPAGWVIVAAGNPPEYNKSVRDFDLVTLDRVRRIDVEPDLGVWQTYARARRVHPAITAFLELRPRHFYRVENDVDGPLFVTARGWEDLSALLYSHAALGLPVDEAVLGQYLRHPAVARDFAAYWALYQKYHADYGVEEILAGHIAGTAVERALRAAFDERMSLVSLLLAGLGTRFAAARRADAVTDACYAQLRRYRRGLDAGTAAGTDETVLLGPAARFAAQCDEYEAETAAGRERGALPAAEAAVRARALALLRRWAGTLDPTMDGDEAFAMLRRGFNNQVRRREQAVAAASEAVEHAFDFVLRAFGDEGGQELVVFVNELALGPDSAPFLADNPCERFARYSQALLLREAPDPILAELARDDIRQNEHSAEF